MHLFGLIVCWVVVVGLAGVGACATAAIWTGSTVNVDAEAAGAGWLACFILVLGTVGIVLLTIL